MLERLFFKAGEFKPESKSPEWNRGAFWSRYRALRRLPHAEEFPWRRRDRSGVQGYAIQGWFAPNITGDKRAASALVDR